MPTFNSQNVSKRIGIIFRRMEDGTFQPIITQQEVDAGITLLRVQQDLEAETVMPEHAAVEEVCLRVCACVSTDCRCFASVS